MIRSIGEIIERDLREIEPFGRLIFSSDIYALLSHIVGKGIVKHLKVLGFKNNTIIIGTPNPVFSQELSFMKDTIIERINQFFEREVVKNIIFKEVY
ncbi:DUF721 domain-containing protein [Hippea jasoniae]|uniref:DUF721 domain-containing protein n=1 Tax=Hippea jasoniae TaxID=944479 RepID=UPI0009FF4622|nr:DUF721 domain-containing protein [Hippea jasoniae]